MKIQYETLDVRLNELHSQRLTVPAWEADVVAAVHDISSINRVGTVEIERNAPSADEEFGRLESRYGGDAKGSFVSQVYGQHGTGMAALGQAIAAAVSGKPESVPDADKAPAKRAATG